MSQAFSADQIDALCGAVPTLEYGALGLEHQWRHITLALQASAQNVAGRPEDTQKLCGQFALEMTVWALQDHPLDARLLRLAADMDAISGCAAGLPVADWLTLATAPDLSAPQYADWHAAHTEDDILQTLPAPETTGEHSLYWIAAGLDRALAGGHFDLALRILDTLPQSIPERGSLHSRLHAQWALHALSAEEALPILQEVKHPGFALWHTRQTAALLRLLGEAESATSLFSDLWKTIGFHPNLTLLLHDAMTPLPQTGLPKGNEAPAIVLYSWNKADELRQTLISLRDSDTGDAPVILLDNGSTDDTAAMLDAMADQWNPALFKRITLPVNVGAPAARNWLLSLPEVKERPWTVFLDDDIILPKNWLHELWGTALAHPEAGAVGCTITDHIAPHAIQCADFHLLPQEMGQRSFEDLMEHTFVYANAAGEHDSSLTAFTRPCMHVSGCCHMINMRSVDACGAFDVRFSPSQFDDLERDMRSCLAGFPSVYNGSLRIRHMQHSSLRQANTPAKNGHIFGNKIKLEHIHGEKSIAQLRDTTRTLVLDDLKRKTTRLHNRAGA
ncbi:glycosyltransferase [Desulfovibrio mangrovi]|uniref:glycosyltransferase family A protein n=1 Tax=Desulfovibrio mangrovi TaxID=2976983 RepID=UPI002246DAA5|nr:glycosyltransferase family 2 protein [Desulfovibrio mangrovi]UZP67935.1 glycosyltransferase [Desulfovibrio mangrovi]